MKAYQLTILVLALCHQQVSAAPRPQYLENGPPLRYTSKYPQHPVNQGYGDNYPKYWLNEAWTQPSSGERKAPVAPGPVHYNDPSSQLYHNPYAPVQDQMYNTQPRNLFVPYPYSETWNNQNTKVPALERKESEVPTFGPQGQTYNPPHGFPRERGAAKAAIKHYSTVAAEEEGNEGGDTTIYAGTEPQYYPEPNNENMSMTKGENGEKSLGLGSDFSGYQKQAKVTPVIVVPRDDGWSEVSYNHDDARRQLSDIPVINEQEPLIIINEPRRRKNAALEKIEGFLGPDEAWHQKRNLVTLEERAEEADEKDSTDVKEVKKKEDGEWPEHIKSKAERMMKAAEAMQQRGSKMIVNDKKKESTDEQAVEEQSGDDEVVDHTAPCSASPDDDQEEADYDEYVDPEEYESEEEEEEIVPVAIQKPVQKTAKWQAPARKPVNNAPNRAPRKKAPTPVAAPAVPGPNKKKNEQPAPPPPRKEDEDPLISGELPERSGRTKPPKRPKSARPAPPPVPVQPQRQKPAHGAKKSQQQGNLPTQSNARKPRVQSLVKRDEAAAPHLVDTMLTQDKMKKMGKMGNMKPQIKGSTQHPNQGSGNNKEAGGPMSSGGRVRPSVNQDRPSKKANKNKSPHVKREEIDIEVGLPKGVSMVPHTGGPLPTDWSLTYAEREMRAQELVDLSSAYVPDDGEWFLAENWQVEHDWDMARTHVKRDANPEADPDAQNRRVIPGGPPVTIRRVLGAGEAVATAHPVHHAPPAVHQVAAPIPAVQIPDGQVQMHYSPAQQIPDGQVQIHPIPAQQIPDGQVQIPRPQMPAPVLPPHTVTVQVPGPVQTIERPQIVEKVVTRIETIERPIYRTEYVHQTATVVQQYPVEHTVVQSVPVHHTVVQNVPVLHTMVQSIPVHHTVIQSVPYPVEHHHTATVVNSISVPYPVQHTVVRSVAVPVQHTVVQKVPYAVEHTHTVVNSIAFPYAVEHTQTVVNSYPVRITLTPEAVTQAVTKVISAPPVTETATATATATSVRTAVEYETVVEKATKVIERVAVPTSSPVVLHKEIHGHQDVVSTYETCRQVPVTKTICVCPMCDQTEEYCGCGTFSDCSGPECSTAECTIITELQCIPRTPKEIEAFVRARIPDEFQ